MSPFFLKRLKKISIVILNIVIIFFSSYFIWQSEKFQEKITPQKYWNNKIRTLETELKKDTVKIKSLKLDLEREIALCPYHEKQAQIKAEEVNQNISKVYCEIETEHIKKINDIKDEIKSLMQEEAKLKSELQIAYNKIKISD
jgi:hypothetical protein